MPDDSDRALKLAILQSITTEASGFYGLIVTVASSFLGGSLLFMEKISPLRSEWSLVGFGVAWISLVASIGCIARLRYYNLKSGRLALDEKFTDASQIDKHTDTLSWWSQTLLIAGMSSLVIMGLINVHHFSTVRKDQMPNRQNNPGTPAGTAENPYGTLGSGNASQANQPSHGPRPTATADLKPRGRKEVNGEIDGR
jgi:hypothetical protein